MTDENQGPPLSDEERGRQDDAERCIAVVEVFRDCGYLEIDDHHFLRLVNRLRNWSDYDPRKEDWLDDRLGP